MFLTCLFCGGNHGNVKKRGNKYAVIYDYYDADGKRRQKWEAFGRKEDAEKFRKKIEYQKVRNTFLTPSDQTVEECLMSWASLYDKSKWSCSIVHLSWLCSAIILFRKSDGYLYRNYSRYMLKCFTTLCERKNVAAQRDTPKTRAGFLVFRQLPCGTSIRCSKPLLTKQWIGKSLKKIRSPAMHLKSKN